MEDKSLVATLIMLSAAPLLGPASPRETRCTTLKGESWGSELGYPQPPSTEWEIIGMNDVVSGQKCESIVQNVA